MVVLPLAYMGNTYYFSKLCFEDCIVDIHEHYVKQSYRNRADILTSNGVVPLSVQIEKRSGEKTPVKDIRIDYSKRWQHQHWISIVSAYKSSPYFDYYSDLFAPFYEKRYEFLLDLDLDLTVTLLKAMNLDTELRLSESYVTPGSDDLDLRTTLSPKPQRRRPDAAFHAEPYCQVFSDRFDFVPDLSVIDLLFCEGPGAREILKACRG